MSPSSASSVFGQCRMKGAHIAARAELGQCLSIVTPAGRLGRKGRLFLAESVLNLIGQRLGEITQHGPVPILMKTSAGMPG